VRKRCSDDLNREKIVKSRLARRFGSEAETSFR